jgi:hypothetical protein
MLQFEDDNPEPNVVAFLPVKNVDDLLDTVSNYAEVEEDGDFTKILPDNGQEVILRKAGNYAFISNKKAMLEHLPDNPGGMVSELGSKYNVAARIYAQRVPEGLRNQVLDFIEQGAESGLDELEQQDELQAELQRANFEMQMKQMKEMMHDTDELLIGMSADKDAKSIYFDMNMKGKAGSQIEKRFTAAKNAGKSQFAGFLLPKAAFSANACTGVTEEDAALYLKTLTQARDAAVEKFGKEDMDEDQVKLLTRLTDNLVDVISKTLKEGKLDMGAVLFTDDSINGVIAAQVAEPKKLEASLKEAVAEAESSVKNGEVQFNLNSGTHRGATLHEIVIKIPDDKDARKVLGETMKVIVGIGSKEIYLGFGKDPLATLKKAMDASASGSIKATQAMEYNLFLAPILKFAAGIEDQPMVQRMAEKLAEAGNDRIRMTSDFDNQEMKVRFEIQDGVLRLFGVAAESMGGQLQGGDRSDF